ncbi:MAG TPA: hypothetical protein VFE88_03735 [Candidatus Nanoarchaeia archaeon]|nr:hypothetical protein [Candidatus Nanoarchaeia archaeon]
MNKEKYLTGFTIVSTLIFAVLSLVRLLDYTLFDTILRNYLVPLFFLAALFGFVGWYYIFKALRK